MRALATVPKVSVHSGHFLTHTVTMPLVALPGQPQQFAKVIKTEEKGSDVNLATHLLHDAHMGSSMWQSLSRTTLICSNRSKSCARNFAKRWASSIHIRTQAAPYCRTSISSRDSRWRSQSGAIPDDTNRSARHIHETRCMVVGRCGRETRGRSPRLQQIFLCHLWRSMLGRRSQRSRPSWKRIHPTFERWLPRAWCPASLSRCSFRRHPSEVGAVCGSSARTDLYGGRSAMTIPTVTGTGTLLRFLVRDDQNL